MQLDPREHILQNVSIFTSGPQSVENSISNFLSFSIPPCVNCKLCNPSCCFWDKLFGLIHSGPVNIGSGNGLVLAITKPLRVMMTWGPGARASSLP